MMQQAYARNSDPTTSHEAAEAVDVTYMEGVVLKAIGASNKTGMTQDDIVEITGHSANTVSPRFKPLLEKGLIVVDGTRAGNSGRKQRVHKVVENKPFRIAPEAASSIAREIAVRGEFREANTRIAALTESAKNSLREAENIAERYNIPFEFGVDKVSGRFQPGDGWYPT
jgi:DNA-binding transcriptional regulator GbsR (MarR family)